MSQVVCSLKWPPEGKPSAEPDYHVVMDGDKVVGRIYQRDCPGGTKWFGLAIRGEHFVPCGVGDTLQDTQAKFRTAWDVADKRLAARLEE